MMLLVLPNAQVTSRKPAVTGEDLASLTSLLLDSRVLRSTSLQDTFVSLDVRLVDDD